MRSVTYSMGVSLDGYDTGADGGFDWTAPDEEVFRFVTDQIRQIDVPCWDEGYTRRCCTGRPPTRIHRLRELVGLGGTHLAGRRLAAPGSSSPSGMPVAPGTVAASRRGWDGGRCPGPR